MSDIVAINRYTGHVLDDAEDIGEVTDWMDDEGEQCDAQDAVVAIAFCNNRWYALDLNDFQTQNEQ